MSKRFHKLPSQNWVNGGNLQIPLKDAPPDACVRAIVLRLEATFTTGAAAAAIASTQLHRLISMIDGGPFLRASGIYWRFLEWNMRGGEAVLPAGLPATNASAFARNITWVVPYHDRRAFYPTDGEQLGADFRDRVLSIDCANAANLDGGTNTWNTLNAATPVTGTLRAHLVLDEGNGSPGSQIQFGFADLTGQAPTIAGGGIITDLFAYRENAGAIDSTQIATAAIQADGVPVADDLKHGEYAASFNQAMGLGGDYEAASAVAPMAGELLSDQPGTGAGAAATITNPYLPLIFQPWGYKLAQAVLARQALRVDYTGSDTTMRVGFRKVYPRSDAEKVQAMQRAGYLDVVSPSQIEAKTGSKQSLSGSRAYLQDFLPLRRHRAVGRR